MTQQERDRFDAIFDQVLRSLPQSVRNMFDDAPLIIEDSPSPDILEDFGLDPDDHTLCGLYSGTPMTDRTYDGPPHSPEHIYIFREGVILQAGGWQQTFDAAGNPIPHHEGGGGEAAIAHEIRITILHELGHHFGLDEDDLMKMGYD